MIPLIKKIIFRIRLLLCNDHERARVYGRYLGIKFGKNTRITGNPAFGSEPYLITIGDDVVIGAGVAFHNHDGGVCVLRNKYPGIDVIRRINVGNNVLIGYNAGIMPGITIGNNVIIGASSLVTKDVPDNVVVGGNPAKIIKTLEQYEEKVLKEAIYIKERHNPAIRKKEILNAIK